ncbi:MAG: hypothetical protein ACEQSE_12190 [Candidatus Aquirickettsiella gammari]
MIDLFVTDFVALSEVGLTVFFTTDAFTGAFLTPGFAADLDTDLAAGFATAALVGVLVGALVAPLVATLGVAFIEVLAVFFAAAILVELFVTTDVSFFAGFFIALAIESNQPKLKNVCRTL